MNKKVIDINEFRKAKNQKLLSGAENIQKKAEKRNRAHTSTFILMLGTAIFFDGLQILLSLILSFGGWAFAAIPVIGKVYAIAASVFGVALSAVVSLFAWLTFYVWTSIKGWGLSDTLKQIIVNWVLPLIEIVPWLNVLPTWTLKVVLSYSFLKAEDALYNVSGGKADAEKLENLLNIFKRAT